MIKFQTLYHSLLFRAIPVSLHILFTSFWIPVTCDREFVHETKLHQTACNVAISHFVSLEVINLMISIFLSIFVRKMSVSMMNGLSFTRLKYKATYRFVNNEHQLLLTSTVWSKTKFFTWFLHWIFVISDQWHVYKITENKLSASPVTIIMSSLSKNLQENCEMSAWFFHESSSVLIIINKHISWRHNGLYDIRNDISLDVNIIFQIFVMELVRRNNSSNIIFSGNR